jgi:hypothetical protein
MAKSMIEQLVEVVGPEIWKHVVAAGTKPEPSAYSKRAEDLNKLAVVSYKLTDLAYDLEAQAKVLREAAKMLDEM